MILNKEFTHHQVHIDAHTRIRVLDTMLFPIYIESIILCRNTVCEDWYILKMFIDTEKMLNLSDCDYEEMKRVFDTHISRAREVLNIKYRRRLE